MERVQPYEKRWWALGVLILSLFVIPLDNTIMNVTLPTLVRELGASATQLQWIVDAYVLVFAGLLLTAGGLRARAPRAGAPARHGRTRPARRCRSPASPLPSTGSARRPGTAGRTSPRWAGSARGSA